jgi:hypothetical protein
MRIAVGPDHHRSGMMEEIEALHERPVIAHVAAG